MTKDSHFNDLVITKIVFCKGKKLSSSFNSNSLGDLLGNNLNRIYT